MRAYIFVLALMVGFCISLPAEARSPAGDLHTPMPPPYTQTKSHTVGNLSLAVTNWGYFATSCEFPLGSEQLYLFQGALWIGARVNGETHVSVGADGWLPENELLPGSEPGDTIVERSNDISSPYYHPDAVSEQDLISVFTDTVGDPYAPPGHIPLEIRVTQSSYCWSSFWIKDFILVRLQIENIREDEASLDSLYAAIYFDGDVAPFTFSSLCQYAAAGDDITGLRRWKYVSDSLWPAGAVVYEWNGWQYVPVDVGGTPKYRSPCDRTDIAWIADDDGLHPEAYCPDSDPALSVVGVRAISLPQEKTSYNWWFSDPGGGWGPHDSTDPGDLSGIPMGDSAKYAFMSGGRIDPDQVCDGLQYPPGIDSISDTRFLISFGPHELAFGETLEVVWAFAGGERFHDGHGWCEWEFADLIMNGNRAYAVYDNPGIDTDGDGYYGDYMIIGDDTLYLTGDGVPDYIECDYPPWNPCDMIVGAEETCQKNRAVALELGQNFPNPFSASTRISFAIPNQSHVDLTVFDICGRSVASIVDEQLKPGRYSYDWHGKDDQGKRIADGVYFYRLSAGDLTRTRKLVVIR
jgi:hypothetical protein